MGSVSQDLFLSPQSLFLSLPLDRAVTMFFIPRLPLLLAIIFLGLFCLPHTINCQIDCLKLPKKDRCSEHPDCIYLEGNNSVERADNARRLCHKNSEFRKKNGEKCIKDGQSCTAKCESDKVVVKDCS